MIRDDDPHRSALRLHLGHNAFALAAAGAAAALAAPAVDERAQADAGQLGSAIAEPGVTGPPVRLEPTPQTPTMIASGVVRFPRRS